MGQAPDNQWILPLLPELDEYAGEAQPFSVVCELLAAGRLRREYPLGRIGDGIRRTEDFPEVVSLFEELNIRITESQRIKAFPQDMLDRMQVLAGPGTEISPLIPRLKATKSSPPEEKASQPQGKAAASSPPAPPTPPPVRVPRLSEIRESVARRQAETPGKSVVENNQLSQLLQGGDAAKQTGSFYAASIIEQARAAEEASAPQSRRQPPVVPPVRPDLAASPAAGPVPLPEDLENLPREWHLPDLPEFAGRCRLPHNLHALRKLIEHGSLSPDHKLRRGEGQWVEAGRYPDLIPVFKVVYPGFEPIENLIYHGEPERDPEDVSYAWGDVAEDAPDRAESVVRERGNLPFVRLLPKGESPPTAKALPPPLYKSGWYLASMIGFQAGLLTVLVETPIIAFAGWHSPLLVHLAPEYEALNVTLEAVVGALFVSFSVGWFEYLRKRDHWEFPFVLLLSLVYMAGWPYVLSMATPTSRFSPLYPPLHVGFGFILAAAVYVVSLQMMSRESGFVEFKMTPRGREWLWPIFALAALGGYGANVLFMVDVSRRQENTITAISPRNRDLLVYGLDVVRVGEGAARVKGRIINTGDSIHSQWSFAIILLSRDQKPINHGVGNVFNRGFSQGSPGTALMTEVSGFGDPSASLKPHESWSFDFEFVNLDEPAFSAIVSFEQGIFEKLRDQLPK